jgi:hypothetical protein
MKKLILGLGVLALTFASVVPASAICRDAGGEIVVVRERVFAQNNMDGSCSGCDYTCSMPILSP